MCEARVFADKDGSIVDLVILWDIELVLSCHRRGPRCALILVQAPAATDAFLVLVIDDFSVHLGQSIKHVLD